MKTPAVETGKATRAQGRYRKVEVRTWGDEKFRALSSIPPCGQGLWLFLITGPHTGPIPGLFRAGRAAMAEELGWDVEAFDKAFQEAFQQGMVKADFKARVMWLPSAIRHNRPESPNVVRSWAAEFDLIPECDLKREALESLRASIHALGEAFGKAFEEAFTKPSPKPSVKPSPKAMANQEQEQEQEKKKRAKPRAAPVSIPVEALIEAGFDGQTAADFLDHKAQLKAPLTERAWADHCREATKAGWTPLQAAEKVMAKGWKGFEAKYVADEHAATAGRTGIALLDTDHVFEAAR